MPSRTGSSSISPAITLPLRALAAGSLLLLAVIVLVATLMLLTQLPGTDAAGGRWGQDGGRWGQDGGGGSAQA